MPKILEIKEIDGDIWCRVGTPGDFESGITLWTPDEQRKKYHEGLKRGAEIAMRKMVEYALSEKECLSPFAAGAKKEFSAMAEAAEEIQNLIMKEAEGEQH